MVEFKNVTIGKRDSYIAIDQVVLGDRASSGITISINRYAGGVDLASLGWSVKVANSAGSDVCIPEKTVSDMWVILKWLYPAIVAASVGKTAIEIEGVGSDGEIVWQSGKRYITVIDDLDATPGYDPEDVSELEHAIEVAGGKVAALVERVDEADGEVSEAIRAMNEAAQNAINAANDIQRRADIGEFNGRDGLPGPQGIPGPKGDSIIGPPGPKGDPGEKGDPGVAPEELTKLSESIANQDKRIDDLESEPKIVWCEYGETTYAEVSAIVADGNVPAVKAVNYYGVLTTYLYAYTSESHTFYASNGENSFFLVQLNTKNVWSGAMRTLQLTSYRVSNINSASTNTQYPSAKAVYDYAEPKKDWVLKGTIVGDENDRGNIDTGVNVDMSGCTEILFEGSITATDNVLLSIVPPHSGVVNGVGIKGKRHSKAMIIESGNGLSTLYAKYTDAESPYYVYGALTTYDYLTIKPSSITKVLFESGYASRIVKCDYRIYAR